MPGAPGRARGDPLRRLLQLAAAADALRGRPGGAPDDARGRGAPRPARGRREPQRPRRRPTGSGRRRSPRACCWRSSRRRWRSSKPRRPARSPRTSPSRAGSPGSAAAPRRRTSSSTPPALQIVEEGFGDPEAHGVWVSPCLLTPESRGSVRLASNDPTARPVIRNRFYSDPADMPRMVDALRLTEEICAQPAMQALRGGALQRAGRRLRRGAARARGADRPSRSTTRSGPARSARSSTPSCASRASRGSASSTPR